MGTIKDTDPENSLQRDPVQSLTEAPAETVEERQPGFAAATMEELRKVVWPSRQQLFSESVAVILMVSASAAAIAAIDRFYSWTATQVFR